MVLVGSRGDSETYVRSKKKACEEIGIKSFGTDLGEDVSQEELLKVQASFPYIDMLKEIVIRSFNPRWILLFYSWTGPAT